MAVNVDRFITSFELLDKYTSNLDKISRKTASFQSKVEGAVNGVKTLTLTLAGVFAAAVGKVAVDAVAAASEFEQFRVTLEALTGSADKTAQKLDFIKRLAIPSTFTFQQLAQAGTQLEAFNVPLEKALPLISKLGAAFPNKELGDFVNLFGRLASGDFPDLEALSGAGLSKLDFMKQGIKFDAQGSLLSSTRDTMNALERIINSKYGGILDKVANTTNAKLATVKDKWEEVLRKAGDALTKYLNPALDKLSAWLENIGKDKNFEKFLQNIGKNFVKFVGVVFGVLGTLLGVMALVKLAFRDFFGAVVLGIASAASFVGGLKITSELGKFFKGLQIAGQQPGAPVNVPSAPPGMEFPDNPALKTLNDIEGNTKQTAENTRSIDFKRYALGGGDIAGMGIQAIDRYRGRGMDRNRSITINAGKDKLSQAVAEIARQVYEQADLQANGGR